MIFFYAYLIVLALLINMGLTVAYSLIILVGTDGLSASLCILRLFGHATASMLL